MDTSIFIQQDLEIPLHELIITTSRASGPGGQHVNKTDSRITLTWYVHNSTACTQAQKERILKKLHAELTHDGALIIHSSASRSQLHNKKAAYKKFAEKLRKALHVPKKRIATTISASAKEKRLQSKKLHSQLKKTRTTRYE